MIQSEISNRLVDNLFTETSYNIREDIIENIRHTLFDIMLIEIYFNIHDEHLDKIS